MAARPHVVLTESERRVLERILLGESNKEIAQHLSCSVKNVEYHVTNILRRTGHSSRLRLLAGGAAVARLLQEHSEHGEDDQGSP